MSYQAHEYFVAPARPRSEFWRLLVGLLACGAIYLGLLIFFGALIQGTAFGLNFNIAVQTEDYPFATGSPIAMAVTFFVIGTFVFMLAAPMIVVRVLHKRSPLTLLGPLAGATASFWRVVKVLIVLNVVLWLLPPYVLPDLIANLPLATWLMWLPLSLLGILIQTSAEELLFRGYLQQQLAARFKSPAIWMLVPAVVFALGHFDPVEYGGNTIFIVAWAGIFSLLASDLTARSGNLGAAIGLHFITNTISVLIVGFKGPLGGLALYHLPFDAGDLGRGDPLILIDFAILLLSWLASRIAIRR